MKKTISIILSVLMIMSMLSIGGFADWYNETQSAYSAPITVTNSTTVTAAVVTNSTMEVKAGTILTIDVGANLTFATALGNENYNLVNNGTIIIRGSLNFVNGAKFFNNGIIEFASTGKGFIGEGCIGSNDGAIINGNFSTIGVLQHRVNISKSFTVNYAASDTYDNKPKTVNYKISYILASELSSDTGYKEYTGDFDKVCSVDADANTYVPDGKILYVKVTVNSGAGDFVDVNKLTLSGGSQPVESARGLFRVIVNSPLSLSLVSVAYKDVVKEFKIELPYTEGYRVITFDGQGEPDETQSDATGLGALFGGKKEKKPVFATVEYGKSLSFRVDLKEGYKTSADKVKVYVDTTEILPDEFGYYDITGPFVYDETTGETTMATAGGVQNNFTIRVMGVASDELQSTMTSIVGYIQQVFSVIKSIFQFFKSIFDGSMNTGDLGKLF